MVQFVVLYYAPCQSHHSPCQSYHVVSLGVVSSSFITTSASVAPHASGLIIATRPGTLPLCIQSFFSLAI